MHTTTPYLFRHEGTPIDNIEDVTEPSLAHIEAALGQEVQVSKSISFFTRRRANRIVRWVTAVERAEKPQINEM
jgi:hypothetical protein